MQNLLEKLDCLASVQAENTLAKWLERASFVLMILMFVSAPHSIAATQIAWLTGMFLWVVRLFLKPRPRLVRTPLDVPLWAFFFWSLLTSIFSYDPPTSLDKLRNVALFLIFYYVINVVKTKRAAVFLALTIITSAMISVVWTPIERIIGRAVEIQGVTTDSPLAKAALKDGDTLLKADGEKIRQPEDLANKMRENETTKVQVYRPDFYFEVELKHKDLLGGETAIEQLGIGGWKRSRNWRSSGFYSHYATFAEVLQLIASLTFGLFIAHFLRNRSDARGEEEKRRRGEREKGRRGDKEVGTRTEETDNFEKPKKIFFSPFLPFFPSSLLFLCVAAMSLALLLTVTRASQLGFLVSALTIVLIVGSRKMLLISALIALPIALGGLVFLQQSRQVGFFDPKDESIIDRQIFYRKGFDLWTQNARHLLLGVGMDANKSHIKEWNLYDNQGKPMGHFHSTPLQLLVERGLPALLLWLWILSIYGRTLLKYLGSKFKTQNSDDDDPKSKIQNPKSDDWRERGIILGGFGGMVGFFASGMVHYNLGDAEVAMAFFIMMGLSVGIGRMKDE